MKKKWIQISSLAACAALLCTPLSACGSGGGNSVDLDPNKETILISVYGGGFGSNWAVDMLNEYNKTLTGKYQFGKIQDNTDDIATINQKLNSGISQADIYFTDDCALTDLVRGNKLLDLSPVWNATPDASSPQRALSEKFVFAEQLSQIASDGQGARYAMPYTMGVSGIVYDRDLFVSSGWLISDTSTANGLSEGADKTEGTYDDGLPATLAEWETLLQKIKSANMMPYVLMGTIGGAGTEHVMESVWAQYEGMESYMTSFDYEGKMYFPSTGTTETITPQTGYKVYSSSEGRDKGIDVIAEYILRDGFVLEKSKDLSHTEAEQEFLFSHNTGNVRVAMTAQGCWWENEARPAFDSDAKRNGARWGYGKRNFGLMPIPQIENQHESSNGKSFYAVNTYGTVFAVKSADTEKNQAILDFLTYFASDKGLNSFTKSVGTMPGYRFEIEDDVYEGLTYFGKDYYQVLNSSSVEVVAPTLFKYASRINYAPMNPPARDDVKSGTRTYTSAYQAFKNGISFDSVKSTLKSTWNETNWSALYREVFGS